MASTSEEKPRIAVKPSVLGPISKRPDTFNTTNGAYGLTAGNPG